MQKKKKGNDNKQSGYVAERSLDDGEWPEQLFR